ncbi:MAG: hypothetical protein U0694_02900 [Anaerolineae bacterium]
MNTELYTTLRELLICAEIILEFEVLDTQQSAQTQQIHHWASFLANLSEKIRQLGENSPNLSAYYRTMDAPLRRIMSATDTLLEGENEALTLNQEYSFQRIKRLANRAASLAQQTVADLTQPSNGAPTQK